MANADPNLVPIPERWRTKVVKILRSREPNQFSATVQSRIDWAAAFPLFPDDHWDEVRFATMASALESPSAEGRLITGMKEPGETYAFWFYHRNLKMYGKINLKPDGKVILIYSSHLPEKGTEYL